MNKFLVIAAVAALASSANAAPAKSSAKTRKTMNQVAAPAQSAPKAGSTATPNTTTGKASPGPGSPATGSNVLTTEQQPKKAANTWSASLVTEITAAAKEVNNDEVEDKNVDSTNYVGLGYQATPANKIGFRQYFKATHTASATKDGVTTPAKDATTMMDPAITINHKGGKLFGSDAITPQLYYFAPVTEASKAVNSNGSLRLDAEIDFTLTPKWTVGYYMSVRLRFLPKKK